MARKRALQLFSKEELLAELDCRLADEKFREDMTISDMELAVESWKTESDDAALAAMLWKLRPEKPKAKLCPKGGKRVPVKARDRERTVKSLSGPVTFKRNYHYCERCQYGFNPGTSATRSARVKNGPRCARPTAPAQRFHCTGLHPDRVRDAKVSELPLVAELVDG